MSEMHAASCSTPLRRPTHPVQLDRDVAIGVQHGRVASELGHLTDDHDLAAHVVVQIRCRDTWVGNALHLGRKAA